jgi:hypothetical protein
MPRKTPHEYLVQLRRIARERGGVLLSRTYRASAVKLRFRCAEGHEFLQAPMHVKGGKWCRKCGRARAAAAVRGRAFAKLRRVVAERRGRILSDEYVNSWTKMRYRCPRGHEWEAVPNSILQGRWCPRCAATGRPINEARRLRVDRRLRRIAAKQGGEMLSPFRGSRTPLRFRCAEGHVWKAKAESIDTGVWCPRCSNLRLLERLRAKAAEHGGALLSRSCRSGQERVEWRCALGHRWTNRAIVVLAGAWCSRCRTAQPHDLAYVRAVARDRGGRCLSKRYEGSERKLRWRCAEGHEWDSKPGSVIQGTWCPVCRRGWGKSRRRLSIEIMREMAAERGGECLSRSYTRLRDRLRWRCARGHEWTTMATVVRSGHWCPVCKHAVVGTLDGMRALAVERGGRCLTRKWDDHREPLSFVCARGHRFRQSANVVKSGVWCPDCGSGPAGSSRPVRR